MSLLQLQFCCVNSEFSGFPSESSMRCGLDSTDGYSTLEECSHHESARLATVPEGRPLASESPSEVIHMTLQESNSL